ncbi:MAG: M48 family metalloprotease [Proteobacteria bacterium]|nr:M48 family metalloprotease [Pseudomonadota bacterium]
MFFNVIQIAVVLLLYLTRAIVEPELSLSSSLSLLAACFLIFTLVCKLFFSRLDKSIAMGRVSNPFAAHDRAVARQQILAIVLSGLYLYVLDLKSWLSLVFPLGDVPTLGALVFMGLFVIHLAVVWRFAHQPYRHFHPSPVSRTIYVRSNLQLSLPMLLPWLGISLALDLFWLLPFPRAHHFLETLWGQAVFLLVFLVPVIIFTPALVPRFWNCRPLPPGPVRERMEAMTRRADISFREILLWPLFGGNMITAGVMGLVARFRYILVTNGLLQMATPQELDAVLAHEIGHVKRRHLLWYAVFFFGFFLLLMALLQPWPYFAFWVGISFPGAGFANESGLLSVLFLIASFVLYFRYVFGYFMRNFEREADLYVFELLDNPVPLITCLQKISAMSGRPLEEKNWHHFGIGERVAYMEKALADPEAILAHRRKLRRSMAAFALLVAMLASGALYLSKAPLVPRHLLAITNEKARQLPPSETAAGFAVLGDLLLSLDHPREAVEAYKKALKVMSSFPEVENNLAWTLVTTQDPELADPVRALTLAENAARMAPMPHILDTLAEAQYANGLYAKAVESGKMALETARRMGDRFMIPYYREQMEKFQKARDGED